MNIVAYDGVHSGPHPIYADSTSPQKCMMSYQCLDDCMYAQNVSEFMCSFAAIVRQFGKVVERLRFDCRKTGSIEVACVANLLQHSRRSHSIWN